MLDRDSAVVIEQVENGFIVTEYYDSSYGRRDPISLKRHVCQSFSELKSLLENHFTHRNGDIRVDEIKI